MSLKNKKSGFTPTQIADNLKSGAKRDRQLMWGFTLVEAVVSISILLVAIITATGLVLSSLKNLHVTKNKVIAAYLAQEGIEIVRSIRDTNFIKGVSYRDALTPLPDPYCGDFNSATLTLPPCGGDYGLYWDGPPVGAYIHDSSATPTIFERRILITGIPNPEDNPAVDPDPFVLQIRSTVNWGGANSGSITVEDRLYDWQ